MHAGCKPVIYFNSGYHQRTVDRTETIKQHRVTVKRASRLALSFSFFLGLSSTTGKTKLILLYVFLKFTCMKTISINLMIDTISTWNITMLESWREKSSEKTWIRWMTQYQHNLVKGESYLNGLIKY